MRTYDVKPEIESFDLSHILKAAEMHGAGEIAETPYVQFVMGVKNVMPADRAVFDFYARRWNGSSPAHLGAPPASDGVKPP